MSTPPAGAGPHGVGAPGAVAGEGDPATVEDVAEAARAVEAALRAHLAAVAARTGEADPGVHEAFHVLREAFLDYDTVLYDVYDEVLPVEVVAYVEEEVEDGREM